MAIRSCYYFLLLYHLYLGPVGQWGQHMRQWLGAVGPWLVGAGLGVAGFEALGPWLVVAGLEMAGLEVAGFEAVGSLVMAGSEEVFGVVAGPQLGHW